MELNKLTDNKGKMNPFETYFGLLRLSGEKVSIKKRLPHPPLAVKYNSKWLSQDSAWA